MWMMQAVKRRKYRVREREEEGNGEPCRQRKRERKRAVEGMIMSGNVRLSIRIWTPINNMLSQSTA